MTTPEQVELTRRYSARLERLADAGGRAMGTAWMGLDGWDEADIARLEAMAGDLMDELGYRGAATTHGYLTLLTGERASGPVALSEVDWRGPFTHYWGALARGESLADALASGEARAWAAGRRMVMSSARRAGDQVTGTRVIGWRRVLSLKPCDWCQVVSTQVYASAQSADFGHDDCKCSVVPVLGRDDPGLAVNQRRLAELRASGTVERVSEARARSRARAAAAAAGI